MWHLVCLTKEPPWLDRLIPRGVFVGLGHALGHARNESSLFCLVQRVRVVARVIFFAKKTLWRRGVVAYVASLFFTKKTL